MPVWTVDHHPASTLQHYYEMARQDSQVVGATLSEESSPSRTVLLVDTGTFARPENDELYAFLVPSPFTRYPLTGFQLLLTRCEVCGSNTGCAHLRPASAPNQNGDVLPWEDAQRIIEQYLAHPEARARLARTMIEPLHRARGMYGVARRLFPVEQLPPGAQVIYDKEPVDTSWIKPGAWGEPAVSGATGEPFQVVSVQDDKVEIRFWRDPLGSVLVDLDPFARTFKPCEEPKVPPTWYERILVDL